MAEIRTAAIEQLTARLWQKLEHSDPGDGPWDALDRETQDLYRSAVRFVFDAPADTLYAACGVLSPTTT